MDRSKREIHLRIKTETTGGRKKTEVDWKRKRKIKTVILRKRNTETQRGGGGRAWAKFLSQLLCDSRTVFQSLSIPPHSSTQLPHIVQANLDKGRHELEREGETWRYKERERERDVLDLGTVCLQLAAWLASSPVSLLWVIAWRDETAAGEKADKKAAAVAGCTAATPRQDRGHTRAHIRVDKVLQLKAESQFCLFRLSYRIHALKKRKERNAPNCWVWWLMGWTSCTVVLKLLTDITPLFLHDCMKKMSAFSKYVLSAVWKKSDSTLGLLHVGDTEWI